MRASLVSCVAVSDMQISQKQWAVGCSGIGTVSRRKLHVQQYGEQDHAQRKAGRRENRRRLSYK